MKKSQSNFIKFALIAFCGFVLETNVKANNQSLLLTNIAIDHVAVSDDSTQTSTAKENSAASLLVNTTPAHDMITIKVKISSKTDLRWGLYATNGTLVKAGNEPDSDGFLKKVDMNRVPAGMYTLKVMGEGVSLQQKLLVEK